MLLQRYLRQHLRKSTTNRAYYIKQSDKIVTMRIKNILRVGSQFLVNKEDIQDGGGLNTREQELNDLNRTGNTVKCSSRLAMQGFSRSSEGFYRLSFVQPYQFEN